MATKSEKIVYASFSRLRADLNCMHDLLSPNHPSLAAKNLTADWKYLLNLASSEFPLRTNYELARILSLFNGANDIEVISGQLPRERVSHRWLVRRHPSTGRESLFKSNETKSAVPHNFTLVKGLAYCSFSRQFVDFAIRSPYARNLLQWARDTYSPDEWYLAALSRTCQLF